MPTLTPQTTPTDRQSYASPMECLGIYPPHTPVSPRFLAEGLSVRAARGAQPHGCGAGARILLGEKKPTHARGPRRVAGEGVTQLYLAEHGKHGPKSPRIQDPNATCLGLWTAAPERPLMAPPLAVSRHMAVPNVWQMGPRDPVVPPQKVLGPSKPTPNTFSKGTTGSLGGRYLCRIWDFGLERCICLQSSSRVPGSVVSCGSRVPKVSTCNKTSHGHGPGRFVLPRHDTWDCHICLH